MDVCLVLSHRCNLACTYCYAGDHHKTDMDDATLDRAVDLLYSDGADHAVLSFFGGEPFLAFAAMQRAVSRAQGQAAGRHLGLQCTTNGAALKDEHVAFVRATGMRTTVSIDGVKEAHDLTRPTAGGGSSHAQVLRGLEALRGAGCQPDAMVVITPDTVPYLYRSVSWLWSLGVPTVRANLVLDAAWTAADRGELREQAFAVASELVARRGRGEQVRFDPFDPAIRRATAGAGRRARPAPRAQIVVAPSGHLYPCAPMVGEDKDGGREAALRLGHLGDGPAAIARRITCDGAGCDDGQGCACAAYLETGDRSTAGPNGLWWAALCDELGTDVGAAIGRQAAPLRREAQSPTRRPFIVGLAAALGGVAIGVPALLGITRSRGDLAAPPTRGCDLPPASKVRFATPPPGETAPPAADPDPPMPGQMMAPTPPPEPVELRPDGGLSAPVEEIRPKGDIAAPDDHRVRGKLERPGPPDER